MKQKTVIIILLVALPLVLGCGRGDKRSALYVGGARETAGFAYNDAAAEVAFDAVMPAPMPQAATTMARQISETGSRLRREEAEAAAGEFNAVERKLIQRAYIRIRVENLDAADASVTGMLRKYDAYAASTEVDENSRSYSLRVPAPHYSAFLAEMNGMGRLLHRSENTEDVTLRYYDLEGRLETKKELLRTFQSYLGKAKTIEEILAVEQRIMELQYDIEGTGMQLRNLANRVDYATVDLSLSGPVAAAVNQNVTFGERIRQMFGNFGAFLSSVAAAIIGIVIYGIPILLLAVFFFWLLFGRIGLLKKLWKLVRGKKGSS